MVIKIDCECNFCIYNRKSTCTLQEPPVISRFCSCESCILVTVDDDYADSQKEKMLRNMDERVKLLDIRSEL